MAITANSETKQPEVSAKLQPEPVVQWRNQKICDSVDCQASYH